MTPGENDLPPVWYGKKKIPRKQVTFPEPRRFWESWRFYLAALVIGCVIAFALSGCVTPQRHRHLVLEARLDSDKKCSESLNTIDAAYRKALDDCRILARECEEWFE